MNRTCVPGKLPCRSRALPVSPQPGANSIDLVALTCDGVDIDGCPDQYHGAVTTKREQIDRSETSCHVTDVLFD